jgi:DNA-binding response OmpR family regulator
MHNFSKIGEYNSYINEKFNSGLEGRSSSTCPNCFQRERIWVVQERAHFYSTDSKGIRPMATILMIDDQASIRELVELYLTKEGFRVTSARNGRDGLFLARQELPDLILLDVMMPDMDGWAFLKEHRKERDTPIIILTARGDETDRVLGLEMGADDYVTKPFNPRELVARVRAVLRRMRRDPELLGVIYRAGALIVQPSAHRAYLEDSPIDLTRTEFDLLTIMMATPGRAFSRWELLERLDASDTDNEERTIDVHIRNLRTKIEPNPSHPRYIETVYGVGYRFAEKLEV